MAGGGFEGGGMDGGGIEGGGIEGLLLKAEAPHLWGGLRRAAGATASFHDASAALCGA
jgi:hypothetical protein